MKRKLHYVVFWAIASLVLSVPLKAEELDTEDQAETTVNTLSPEQISDYQFQNRLLDSEVEVKDLTVGQRAIMSDKRRAAKDLMARRLGVLRIRGTREDLPLLQQVIDRNVIRKTQVEEWQGIGILFGDILAKEFSLKWVNYEDEQGANKALRYRNTENYFFPVTLFSRRARFDQDIDMYEVYAKLKQEIQEVREFENRPKLPHS